MDPDIGIFLEGFLSILRYVVFDNLVYIAGKTDQIIVKILSYTYLWTKKSPLNFGTHLDWDSGFALAEVCAVRVLLC